MSPRMMKEILTIMVVITLAVDGLFAYSIACTVNAIAESSWCLTPIFAAERNLNMTRIILIPLVLITVVVSHISRNSQSRQMRLFSFISWGSGVSMLVADLLL